MPVLITGPNGTGKERIAAIVHANSAVKRGPFVAVNCGALPGELIEAELFGADAGAYTGANKAREGRFELADGGTLFLDEIGNLPLPGQMKLLRVLETGQFERLGSGRTRQVKVRVLSATNADLKAMIKAGTFREDLYYRLNVIEVNLPPLAERSDDILPLAEYLPGWPRRAGRRRARGAAGLSVAGQRARAEECDRARGAAVRRAADHAGAAQPAAARRVARAQSGRAQPRGGGGGAAQGRRRGQPRGAAAGAVAPGAVPAHGALRAGGHELSAGCLPVVVARSARMA